MSTSSASVSLKDSHSATGPYTGAIIYNILTENIPFTEEKHKFMSYKSALLNIVQPLYTLQNKETDPGARGWQFYSRLVDPCYKQRGSSYVIN